MAKPRTPPPADNPDRNDVQLDDGALFRDAIGPVRALPQAPMPPARPKPAPRARMAERDEINALNESRRFDPDKGLDAVFRLERGDVMSWRRDNVTPRVLRRLSRGEFSAQDELDLHHTAARSAEQRLRRFLAEARDAGLACVRIIHGKGLNSEDSLPVLKNVVDRTLRHRADVLAFHSAPVAQGGTGAVLVLLVPR